MSFVRTALYVKNVPPLERVVRVVFSLAGAAAALAYLSQPWSWLLGASALGFSVTGFVGFCPACALFGRRLVSK
jgi:hypothetical protein